MPFVAYANKPHKSEAFANFGCTTIVTTLDELLPTTAIKSQIHQQRGSDL